MTDPTRLPIYPIRFYQSHNYWYLYAAFMKGHFNFSKYRIESLPAVSVYQISIGSDCDKALGQDAQGHILV